MMLQDTAHSVEGRFELWAMGMERVKLAPFFGIAISPISDDSSTIDVKCPHNEFIAMWTFHGFVGLIAYIILILGFIYRNINLKRDIFGLEFILLS